MKLQTKLTSLLLMFIIVSGISISCVTNYIARRTVKDQLGTNFINIAKDKAASIHIILNEMTDEAERLASTQKIVEAVRNANRGYLGKSEDEIKHSITDRDEVWIRSNSSSKAAGDIFHNNLSTYLKTYQERDGSKYGEIIVTDERGATIAMTKILSDYYQADEFWWERGFNEGRGRVFIDDSGYDESAGVIVLGVVVPIYDDGIVIGILKINFSVREVMSIVTDKTVDARNEIFLVRSTGDFVFSSDVYDSKTLTAVEKDIVKSGTAYGRAEDLHEGKKTIMGYATINIEMSARIPASGEKRGVAGEKWVPSRWYLFTEIDQDSAFLPLKEISHLTVIIQAVFIFIGIFLAYAVARAITNPIKKLQRGVKEVADGNLDTDLQIESRDEIGQLAHDFSEMTRKLRSSTVTLSELNREIVKKKDAEKKLNDTVGKLQKREIEVMALFQCASLVLIKQDFKQKARTIFESCKNLIGATSGYVALLSENGSNNDILFLDDGGLLCSVDPDLPMPITGLPAHAYTSSRAVYENNFSRSKWTEYMPEGNVGLKNVLFSPLVIDGKSVGIIGLENKPEDFTVDDCMLAEAFGELAAIALFNDRAREEIEKAYADLKNSQSQILQREKMASIGQLAAGVAHEINNPVGYISSNLGTLKKYTDRMKEFMNAQSDVLAALHTVEAEEQLQEMKKNLKLDYVINDINYLIDESLEGAERVTKIVKNLKSFSRVDEAEYKMSDINECLESTLNIVWNELKYKASVEKEYGDIPSSKCYPQQLNQVFMNLLVNAAQAIEKQGIVKIKTWSADGMIYVSILDTGKGISPEEMDRIFEPFYTTKEVDKGTGLGLSITYEIVKKHRGEIIVESEPGRGSTFIIKIPVVEEKELCMRE